MANIWYWFCCIIVVSGQRAFEILPQELKELAFKTQVKYAAHPYLWMSKAKARSTGLGMVSEGKELTKEELPEIEPEHIKIYPMVGFLYSFALIFCVFTAFTSCGRTLLQAKSIFKSIQLQSRIWSLMANLLVIWRRSERFFTRSSVPLSVLKTYLLMNGKMVTLSFSITVVCSIPLWVHWRIQILVSSINAILQVLMLLSLLQKLILPLI